MATPPTVLVLSCSLDPQSKSHRLAEAAAAAAPRKGAEVELVDLRDCDLPMCDGRDSFDHPSVQPLAEKVERASAILLSSPVYNYDLNAAAKNAVEMTGQAWREKPVGFLCVAGGHRSYMSPIGLANSLMFDFRCHIVPRFVYATQGDFDDDGRLGGEMRDRVEELMGDVIALARALAWIRSSRADPLP